MLSGMLVGWLLRRHRLMFLSRVVMFLIWVLLFLLGVEVGANPDIIRNIKSLGVEALALAFAGTLGSVLLAWGLWRYTERRKEK